VATRAALALIVTAYALCVFEAKSLEMPASLLLRHGGLTETALRDKEYSRLLTHAFLHIGPLHLLFNSACLMLWGGATERRLGAANVIVILIVSAVMGALAMIWYYDSSFVTGGASGAISGLLGALLGLSILGSPAVGWLYIAECLILNAIFPFIVPVAWIAHIGGFFGGVATVFVLRIAAAISQWTLLCKFPEFVKVNLLIAVLAFGVLFLSGELGLLPAIPITLLMAAFIGVSFIVIKLTDIVLSLKKGLAVVILALSAANGVVAAVLVTITVRVSPVLCSLPGVEPPSLRDAIVATCKDPMIAATAVGAIAAIATLAFYARDFQRGLWDVGFVAATLEANRRRQRGL
jgi:rhomboid protease GluP